MKGYTHLSFRKMDDAACVSSNRRKSHRCSLSFDKAISGPYFCMREATIYLPHVGACYLSKKGLKVGDSLLFVRCGRRCHIESLGALAMVPWISFQEVCCSPQRKRYG
ncbi:hypothetical protein HanXRQr2_Chr02g0059361 [Helianthus annuus]|uniref:Uncharacterized protein n=1 Tax=Helianthus annuus TaxID=4232 RepID=A0A251UXA4_HELAN|nr:hypothetical protein HanXRQr2_Chr02g0059361 [Helianthus annuus]